MTDQTFSPKEKTPTMTISVNGQEQSVPVAMTVRDLIVFLGLGRSGPVAVERNHRVVPKARHGVEHLAAGDRLELVTLVGGG